MNTGRSGRRSFTAGRRSRPFMPGMLMSDTSRPISPPTRPASFFECGLAGQGEVDRVMPLAHFTPELLPKQHHDIRFVIDDQHPDRHNVPPSPAPSGVDRPSLTDVGTGSNVSVWFAGASPSVSQKSFSVGQDGEGTCGGILSPFGGRGVHGLSCPIPSDLLSHREQAKAL